MNGLYAAAGARGCGKTSTLALLAARYGYRVHAEAHNQVLAELGARAAGHPEHERYARIERADHFCPMCRPFEFCARVLARQAQIEGSARPRDFVDHGWLEAVEYACRRAGVASLPTHVQVPAFAPYARVFLFTVMPQLQAPRWGLDVSERSAEAYAMNSAIATLYQAHGMSPSVVPPGTIAERAEFIHEVIRRETRHR